MPGVLMVEAIAQLAGIASQTDPQIAPLEALKLTGVRAAKILGAARPGERLRIEARIDGRMGGLIQASGSVWHQDKKLVESSVVLSGTAPQATPPQ
jgi:3-hydroxyacyl-[acyl-carrier-protein] dehydratase